MGSLYDISVLTLISKGAEPHAKDDITFYGVGETVRSVIAGSCKTTLFKLMRLPEDKSSEAWNLKYRTVVRQAGTDLVVSDTKLITFPGMDDKGISEFKRWAVQQLLETIEAVEAERVAGPIATKRRTWFLTLLKMLWGRQKLP